MKNLTTVGGNPRKRLKTVSVMIKSGMLFLLFFFQLHASAYSQQIKLSLKMENVSLQKVFTEIEKMSDFSFVYNVEDLKNTAKISIDFTDASIEEILARCLKDTDIQYSINDKHIVITKKYAESKTIKIKGRVSDEYNNALAGATVLIKGSSKGTTTDANGNYSIKVPEKAVLVFSFVGFLKQEVITSSENSEINISLKESVAELGEVAIISTGYQKIKPEQSTGSIATIKAKEYDSRINGPDFLTSLENRIPGLLINNDIEFNGNSLFQIRGISTINGNKDPLIVIDGFPTELSLDMINPNEIESVTVLKDAAAATIYGVRASNGVIVIERKKAKPGKVKVDFRATASFRPKENYDRYRWDDDASNIFINYKRDTDNTGSYMWSLITNPNIGMYYDFNPLQMVLAQEAAGVITANEAEQIYSEMGSYNNANDYARLFLRTAVTQAYNLSISGGDKNVLYYLTANYTNKNASEIRNDNNSLNLSGRATIKLSGRFSLDLTTELHKSKSSSAPIPNIGETFSYERFEDQEGNPLSIFNGSRANSYYNDHLISIGLLDNLHYPLIDINEISTKGNSSNNRVTANFQYNVGEGFTISFGGIYESSQSESRYLASEKSSVVRQYVNRYAENNDSGGFIYNIPKGDFLKLSTSSAESYTIRAQINYDKLLKKDHSLNLIFGSEIRDVLNKSNLSSYFGYSDQTLAHQTVDYDRLLSTSFPPYFAGRNPTLALKSLFDHGYNDNRFFSLYTNIVYSYKGKYSMTGSFRIDQSNLFGTDPKYRYKPLWSVGAAWNIHKENFMQNLNWINSLKLRLAYGFNGNVAKDALPEVIAENGYNYTDPSEVTDMLSLYSYANSGLRWEQTRNVNIGLDYDIFKNVTGSIDFYSKKSTDLLASKQIDASKGGSSALINQASIRNNGFEVSLHADWITRKNFNWNTGFIFSYNSSKVLDVYTELNENSLSNSWISASYTNFLEGYSIGAMFNYRYAGLNSEGAPMIYDKEGNAKTFFTDDDGILEVDYVGSSIPKISLGFSNRVDIGNFYAYCMLNFYGGFKTRVPVPFVGDSRPLEGAGNYWIQEGDENDPAKLPYPTASFYTNLGYTDKYTVSGSYLTLSDLTVSYSFRDSKLVKKTRISNFEVRLQGSNLYTVGLNKYNFSKATGGYAKSYITPTYTIGLYVNF